MTGAQASYLKTLCEEANAEFDAELTKAEASKRIEELQKVTGEGRRRRNQRFGLTGNRRASQIQAS